MEAAGAGVSYVGGDGTQAQGLHEGLRRLAPALYTEGHHAAGTLGQVLPGGLVVGVAGEAAVLHPSDLGVALEILGDGQGVFAVALHADVEAF